MTQGLELAREQMLRQQLRCWDVLNPRVLKSFATLPREEFVPPAFRGVAYADAPIPLDHEQIMMAPSLEGRITQALEISPADKVLDVGTGSGYLAACMSKLAGEVISIDIHAAFIEAAQQRMDSLGICNCELRRQDVFTWEATEKFDAIAVTGSIPDYLGSFDHWLKPGGRLVLVVGRGKPMQAVLRRKLPNNQTTDENLFETQIPALIGAEQAQQFIF